jgi:hypothetical protein
MSFQSSVESQHMDAFISGFISVLKTSCCEGSEWVIRVNVQPIGNQKIPNMCIILHCFCLDHCIVIFFINLDHLNNPKHADPNHEKVKT